MPWKESIEKNGNWVKRKMAAVARRGYFRTILGNSLNATKKVEPLAAICLGN